MVQQTYSGAPIALSFPFEDEDGATFQPTAASWKLYDQAEVLITTGDVASIDSATGTITITIDGACNTIVDKRAARRLEVEFKAGGATVAVIEQIYLVAQRTILTRLDNSFMSYPEAIVLRESIGGMLDGWDPATRRDRVAALEDAFSKIARMTFTVPVDDPTRFATFDGEDEGDIAYLITDIRNIPIAQFDALCGGFRMAIARAQLLEADNLLGGDIIGKRRRDGILSETVGESSMMFNSRPAIEQSLSKPAMRELRGYVYRVMGIGRG